MGNHSYRIKINNILFPLTLYRTSITVVEPLL